MALASVCGCICLFTLVRQAPIQASESCVLCLHNEVHPSALLLARGSWQQWRWYLGKVVPDKGTLGHTVEAEFKLKGLSEFPDVLVVQPLFLKGFEDVGTYI